MYNMYNMCVCVPQCTGRAAAAAAGMAAGGGARLHLKLSTLVLQQQIDFKTAATLKRRQVLWDRLGLKPTLCFKTDRRVLKPNL